MRYVMLILLTSVFAASFAMPPQRISVFHEHHHGQDAFVFWQEGTKWICLSPHSPYRVLKENPKPLIETLLHIPENKECGTKDRLKLIDRTASPHSPPPKRSARSQTEIFRSNVVCLNQPQAKRSFENLQALCDQSKKVTLDSTD